MERENTDHHFYFDQVLIFFSFLNQHDYIANYNGDILTIYAISTPTNSINFISQLNYTKL